MCVSLRPLFWLASRAPWHAARQRGFCLFSRPDNPRFAKLTGSEFRAPVPILNLDCSKYDDCLHSFDLAMQSIKEVFEGALTERRLILPTQTHVLSKLAKIIFTRFNFFLFTLTPILTRL